VDEALLQEKIGQLLSEVHRGRAGGELLGAEGASRAPVGMRREMAALEDGLDHLRVAIKYMVFDLEATKRENRMLRKMLG
jgi:hypothetical protein